MSESELEKERQVDERTRRTTNSGKTVHITISLVALRHAGRTSEARPGESPC